MSFKKSKSTYTAN